MRLFYSFAIVSCLLAAPTQVSRGADAVKRVQPSASADTAMRNAVTLYLQQNYAAAADTFETVIASSPPSARLYYYAALANKGSNRSGRARQLCSYILVNFSASPESNLAKALYPDLAPPVAAAAAPTAARPSDLELPETVKNSLSPEMQALLSTAAGKDALRESLQGRADEIAKIKKAESDGVLNKSHSKIASTMINQPEFGAKVKGTDRPFSPEDIARDGAHGIDQSRHPNCWFEASMAALSELPRGQKLMSSLIRYGQPGSYVVRFPGDGQEYVISEETLAETGVHDKALWATIIECAELQKFPENQGANGEDGSQSRLEIGLKAITGCKAEVILPANSSESEISTFIGGAISSKNPIVAATFASMQLLSLPSLVVPQHAYTVIGFEPSTNLITLRNPHGMHASRFYLSSDPNHRDFQQLDDGVFKISIPLFQKYFHSVARSFI